MKHLENDGERVWAAKTRSAIAVWPGWLAGLLQPDYKKEVVLQSSEYWLETAEY